MDFLTDHPMTSELAELADGSLGPADEARIREHLAACPVCQVATSRDPGPMGADAERFTDALSSLTELPRVASWLIEAVAARRRPDPAPGQLWQVSDGNRAGLAVVLRLENDRPLVLPVALEPEMADEMTVILPASATALDAPLAVWIRFATLVDASYLGLHVADLPVISDLDQAYSDFAHGRPLAEPTKTGVPIRGITDPRWMYREDLRETFAWFSAPSADAAQPEPQESLAAASAISNYAADLPTRLRGVLKTLVPEARVLIDSEADILIGASLPLELSSVVHLADLAIRVAIDTEQALRDPSEGIRVLEAANLVGLLRDCERLAIVVDDDDYTTYLLDSYHINIDLPQPGRRRQARLPDPEPLALAFGRLREQYLGTTSFIQGVEVGRVTADLDQPARRGSREAISEQAGRSFEALKKEAFEALDNDAATRTFARFVAGSRERSPEDYDSHFERLVDEVAA